MIEKKGPPTIRSKDYSKNRAAILRYFLKLFKHQINASSQSPFEVKRLEGSALGSKFSTFELKVEHNGEWISRRMTIAPLGEESGSKSICFYVIYDDHLVVKIPPSPITDLNRYLDSIYADQRIVFRLEPRACVVPGVSVILKRLYSFPGDRVGTEKMEGKYISWLKKNVEFQEYLKIDDSFVFFMDLSRFGILGDVLTKLHMDDESRFFEEITGNKGIITGYHFFEGRYGHAKGSLGFELNKLYSTFETSVQEMLSRSKIQPSTLQYKIEDWFLWNLAGKKVEASEKHVSPAIVEEINGIFHAVTSEKEETVSAYRSTVREYLHQKYFAKSKPRIEGIITNILDLLAWLRNKGVAMRDFKPDNILVTGDPEKNPNFLSSPDQYQLGLIDVETAVIYKTHEDEKIEQPQLGGTPFFATPSQLFQNAVLQEVYKDLPAILYLQDWYATIAMVYFVVTGGKLFEKTAMKIPGIIRIIEKARQEKSSITDVLKKTNTVFWQSAASEFQTHIKNKEALLKTIQVSMPETAKKMFLQNMQDRRLLLLEMIRDQVLGQPVFEAGKNREQLLKASAKQITGFRRKMDDSENPGQVKKMACLKKLEALKTELEELDENMQALVKTKDNKTVYFLLVWMFQAVFHPMQIVP
jgi:serine/threonine protein kinase